MCAISHSPPGRKVLGFGHSALCFRGYMKRRDFITLFGGAAAAWPLTGRAQQARTISRIGFLRVGAPPPSFIEPLKKALKELGYVEGENFIFDYALAKHVAELPKLAADLVGRKVDVLVASGTPAVIPARNATNTIPIVFVAALDPVATGVVTNLARPGGNVTGFTALFADLTGKRLELLKELMPSLTRVALLSRPANPGHYQYVQRTLEAARILRIELDVMAVNSADDFEAGFRNVQGVGALIPACRTGDEISDSGRVRISRIRGPRRLLGARAGLFGPLPACRFTPG